MSELKRTDLRHRLLGEVVNHQARPGVDGWCGGHGYRMAVAESASLTRMQRAVGIVVESGGVWLPTDAARDLLAAWNDQYGEVQP